MKAFLYLVIAAALLLTSCGHGPQICDGTVYAEGADPLQLTSNEKALVCASRENAAWRDIPLSQKEFQIRAFLRERGYFHPKMRVQNGALYVDRGKPLVVQSIRMVGIPVDVPSDPVRAVMIEPVTRDLLNRIEATMLRRLKNAGYACAEVASTVTESTGVVEVKITAGKRYLFPEENLPSDAGLFPEAIRRFYAFEPGWDYDQRLLNLSTSRLESDGLVVSSVFTSQCGGEKILLRHGVREGESKLLTLGVGASTEEYPIGRARWRNVRLGKNGSSFEVSLYASQRRQTATATLEWHFSKDWSRGFLAPEYKAERLSENKFHVLQTQVSVPLGESREFKPGSINWKAGPSLVRSFSYDDERESVLTFVSADANLDYKTHEYELYRGSPRTGFEVSLFTRSMIYSFPKKMDAQLLRFSGTHLVNIGDLDEPYFVLAARYVAGTTITNEVPTRTAVLPANYFHYLGGDRDLRGFGRNELPNNDAGALTVAALGLEARVANTLPGGLQPFVFTDWGSSGLESLDLDSLFFPWNRVEMADLFWVNSWYRFARLYLPKKASSSRS